MASWVTPNPMILGQHWFIILSSDICLIKITMNVIGDSSSLCPDTTVLKSTWTCVKSFSDLLSMTHTQVWAVFECAFLNHALLIFEETFCLAAPKNRRKF